MSTIKHRAETPIPPEKGDAVQTSISSEIFQQRADLEKGGNCPQAENSELFNVLKIA